MRRPPRNSRYPPANDFIPSDFTLRCDDGQEGSDNAGDGVPPAPPILLTPPGSGGSAQVWHRTDSEFRKPKCDVEFALLTECAYESPLASVMASLFCQVVEDALTPFAYDASVASLDFGLSSTTTGVSMSFGGFSHKLNILIRKVAETLRSIATAVPAEEGKDSSSAIRLDESRFHELLELQRLSLSNFDNARPQQWCAYNSQLLLNNVRWSLRDKLSAIESGDVTVDAFQQFTTRLLDSCSVRAVFHGNIGPDQAQFLSEMVQRVIQKDAVVPRQCFRDVLPGRTTILPGPSCDVVHRMSGRDNNNENSAIQVIFQIVPPRLSSSETSPSASFRPYALSIREEAVARLVAHLMKQPCFAQLRTVEQLGYLVSSGFQRNHGLGYVWIMVQSKIKGPAFLNQRVSAFVNERFRADVLASMSRDTFETNVKACISKWGEKDKRMRQRSRRFGAALGTNLYPTEFNARFDRANALAEALARNDGLEALWQDVLGFVDAYVTDTAPLRKRLTLQVVAAQHEEADAVVMKEEHEGERVYIGESSADAFKAGLSLYPQKVTRWVEEAAPAEEEEEAAVMAATAAL